MGTTRLVVGRRRLVVDMARLAVGMARLVVGKVHLAVGMARAPCDCCCDHYCLLERGSEHLKIALGLPRS